MNFFSLPRVFSILLFALVSGNGCSDTKKAEEQNFKGVDGETYPIENTKLRNCRLRAPSMVLTRGSSMTPNPVICDDAIPTKGEILGNVALPIGVRFNLATLSLEGTPTEKISSTVYKLYLENKAGYTTVDFTLEVR